LPLLFGGLLIWQWRKKGGSFWQTFGLTIDRQAPLELAGGIGIGAIVMLCIFGIEWAFGAIRVEGLTAPEGGIWIQFAFLIFAALLEEILSRSLLLGGLVILLRERKWLAMGISAVFFGLAHAANPNASIISIFGNALGGVMYAIAFLESGRIWLAWGLHFAWNFFQGPILGFPVSGEEFTSFVRQVPIGSDLITGGDYGPEAGLVGIIFRFVAVALLYGWFSLRKDK